MDYTVSYTKQHPETVTAAARRRNDVRIVADNGQAWAKLSSPCYLDGDWIFQIDGLSLTPEAIKARAKWQDWLDENIPGGYNTASQITGGGGMYTVENAAAEVRRFSLKGVS